MKRISGSIISGQKGQAALMALIALSVGAIIASTFLSLAHTSLKLSDAYDLAAQRQHAAQAGLEWGVWGLQNRALSPGATSGTMHINNCEVELSIEENSAVQPDYQRVYTVVATALDTAGNATVIRSDVALAYDMWDFAIVALDGDITITGDGGNDPHIFPVDAGGNNTGETDADIYAADIDPADGEDDGNIYRNAGNPNLEGTDIAMGNTNELGGITGAIMLPGMDDQVASMNWSVDNEWTVGTPVPIANVGSPVPSWPPGDTWGVGAAGTYNEPVFCNSTMTLNGGTYTFNNTVRIANQLHISNDSDVIFSGPVSVGGDVTIVDDGTTVLFEGRVVVEVYFPLGGYTDCIATDIGETVRDDGVAWGTLLAYDNNLAGPTWTVAVDPAGDLTGANGSLMTIFGGAGQGTASSFTILGMTPLDIGGYLDISDEAEVEFTCEDLYGVQFNNNPDFVEGDIGKRIWVTTDGSILDWGVLRDFNNLANQCWVAVSGTPTVPTVGASLYVVDGEGTGSPTAVLGEIEIEDYITIQDDASFSWWGGTFDATRFSNSAPLKIRGANTVTKESRDCSIDLGKCAVEFDGPIHLENGSVYLSNGTFSWFTDNSAQFLGSLRVENGDLLSVGAWSIGNDCEFIFSSTVFLDTGELWISQSLSLGSDQTIQFMGPFSCGGSFDSANFLALFSDTDITFGGLTNLGGHFDVDLGWLSSLLGSDVIVRVLDNLVAGDYILWNGSGQAANAADDIPVIVSRHSNITYEGDDDIWAISYGPEGTITLNKSRKLLHGDSTYTGSMIGRDVALNPGYHWWFIDTDVNFAFPTDIRNRSSSLVGRGSGQESTVVFSWGPLGR
jgi:hypothetical protein